MEKERQSAIKGKPGETVKCRRVVGGETVVREREREGIICTSRVHKEEEGLLER